MKKIIDIPLTSVASVELFLNKFRYSIAQVSAQAQKKRRDCKAYVVTGGMWNSNGSACPLLKADGVWISDQPWSAYGYAWDSGPDIQDGVLVGVTPTERPEPEPEPVAPMTTEEAALDAIADLSYRMDLQTLGLTEGV
jgi:hypothetical protein